VTFWWRRLPPIGNYSALPPASARLAALTMRVLIVDDEVRFARSLRRQLLSRGYEAEACHNVEDACRVAGSTHFDAITLDWHMPGDGGEQACAQLRALGVYTPIIVLTGDVDDNRLLDALAAGADDFSRKPMGKHFFARLEALIRRGRQFEKMFWVFDDLVVDGEEKIVRLHGAPLSLSRSEIALLIQLAKHSPAPVTRNELARAIWASSEPESNVLEVLVGAVRKKLGSAKKLLLTERRVGYRLCVASDDAGTNSAGDQAH